jgi:hypothetical protein
MKPWSRTMIAQLFAVALGSHAVVTVADKVPSFNVEPSCSQTDIGVTQDKEACLTDEKNARAEIERTWSQFSAADRNSCVSISSGWHPTYTELLTCLELYRDARELRKQTPPSSDADITPRREPRAR